MHCNRTLCEGERKVPAFPAPSVPSLAAQLAGLEDSALAKLLVTGARQAFTSVYDNPALAKALAVYRAGIMFGLITENRSPENIARFFGMDECDYYAALNTAKCEAIAGAVLPFERACAAMMWQVNHLTKPAVMP